MVRPDFRPITLISISRDRERRSLKASFRAGMGPHAKLRYSCKVVRFPFSLLHSRKILTAAPLLLRRTVWKRADVRRMRKLQIDERVFAVQLNLYHKGRADIVDLP